MARAQSVDILRDELGRGLVRDYEALAKWCTSSKLIKSRAQICEAILHFEPENEKARRWLKHERDEQGRWVRPKDQREPKNYNPDAIGTFRKRRAEIAGRFTEPLLRLLEAGKVSPLSRHRTLKAILAADPDNARGRELSGEEREDGSWLLSESITARLRRRQLRLVARAEIGGVVDPTSVEPTAAEKKLGIRWQAAYDGTDWRCVGSVASQELLRAARIAEAARPVFEAVFEIPTRRRRHSTFYLLRGPTDAQAMFGAHAAFSDKDREYYRRLAGAWIPGTTDFVQWGTQEETRIDAVTRMVCSFLMAGNLSIEKRPGWAVEGVGIYLTHLLTGTRRTLLVRRTGYHEQREDPTEKLDLWERTQMPGADWLGLVRDLHRARKAPDLRLVMSKDLNQLTIEDVLCAHALAAYLIEGRPDDVVSFLNAVGKGMPMDKVVNEHLRTSVEGLARRLWRWLEETES
jgi:hypothetical protein